MVGTVQYSAMQYRADSTRLDCSYGSLGSYMDRCNERIYMRDGNNNFLLS